MKIHYLFGFAQGRLRTEIAEKTPTCLIKSSLYQGMASQAAEKLESWVTGLQASVKSNS